MKALTIAALFSVSVLLTWGVSAGASEAYAEPLDEMEDLTEGECEQNLEDAIKRKGSDTRSIRKSITPIKVVVVSK